MRYGRFAGMMEEVMRIGALEAGGTKMVLAIGNEHGEILAREKMPTLTPEETVPAMINWFKEQGIDTLGVASFGPVDVKPGSPTYGRILMTPKLAWRQYDLLKTMQEALGVPAKVDSDVNGSCLGEMTYGQAKGLDTVLYLTIGTGIGAGIAVGGKLVHGMLHPEAGHVLITKREDDPGTCICPSHDHCFEGLASGPSIEKRWGKKAHELKENPLVWEIEADYIAQGLVDFILTVSPQMIILGGGVMHQEQLFPLIRAKVVEYLNGYLQTPEILDIDHYIVPASLDDDQGILGAIKLGIEAYEEAANH